VVKAWLWLGLLLTSLHASACLPPASPETPRSPLIGKWQFYKVIYKGEERPPFNPSLILTFEFKDDGEDILRWERQGESGFCERKGRWNYADNFLEDEVVWVNPENNRDCGMDPDMRMGNKTRTRAELHKGDFHLYFPVNEEILVYVFKRTDVEATSPQ
jgi:hypothetical protein